MHTHNQTVEPVRSAYHAPSLVVVSLRCEQGYAMSNENQRDMLLQLPDEERENSTTSYDHESWSW